MTGQRKRRTKAHVQADIASRYVEWMVARAGYIAHRPAQGNDHGVDLFVETFNRQGYRENEAIRVQIKSLSRPRMVEGGAQIALSISKRDLAHWLDERMPVALIVYLPARSKAYWAYVQNYFVRRFGEKMLQSAGRSQTIHVSLENEITPRVFWQLAKVKNEIVAREKSWSIHA